MDSLPDTRANAAPPSRFGLFVRNFLRHPLEVGTFAPSSRPVVARIIDAAAVERARCVVEFGPGVGTITEPLLERMPDHGRLLAIEHNDEFVDFLRRAVTDPRLLVETSSAEMIAALLAEHRLPEADVVVSGIPLSTIGARLRREVLATTRRALRRDGRLIVYQYSAAARPALAREFTIEHEAVEWRNAWPMHLFVCRPKRRS